MPYVLRDQSGQFPTLPSAVSAMCASEQDRFFDYHHAMFELQGTSLFNTEAGFMNVASSLGMDTEAFSSCLQNNNYADAIMRNVSAAQTAGVRSTPTFYINGRQVAGNLPNISDFQQIIDAALGS
jgi:protein-disulfide isomerase